jgi:Uma2 family endonuclease
MDIQVPVTGRTTQAAEGLPRWRWTIDELVRLTELGVFSDMEPFELFGGEMVPMSPVGRRHTIIADHLADRWTLADPTHVRAGEEKQFNLDDTTYAKPDVLVWPRGIEVPDLRGPTVMLVVEVADSSLKKDRVFKRHLYAAFGVREYWVIDANSFTARVHQDLVNGDYASVADHPTTDLLTPTLAPALAIRLADLGL